MKFISTNGGFSVNSFSDAILIGICPDGGFLMPENYPELTNTTLTQWKKLGYADILINVLQMFTDEFSEELFNVIPDIKNQVFKDFPEELIPVKSLSTIKVAELFHGPTKAFKDYATFPLGFLMNYLSSQHAKCNQSKSRKKHNIVIATTGDTGSSVIEATRAYPETLNVFSLYPKNRISEIQRLFMTTANTPNGYVVECPVTGDDLDAVLAKLFEDKELCSQFNLTGMNSVNCGRIICQIAIHVYVYLQTISSVNERVQVLIPCGGWGNLISACLAIKMGLPIDIILCTNQNDLGDRMMRTGQIQIIEDDECKSSWSCAMDTRFPYNIVRLLWLVLDQDSREVRRTMDCIKRGDTYQIPDKVYYKLREFIRDSYSANEAETLSTINQCKLEEKDYLICPHTATALSYHYNNSRVSENIKKVALATASPLKFFEALNAAGQLEKDNCKDASEPQINDSSNVDLLEKLHSLPEKYMHNLFEDILSELVTSNDVYDKVRDLIMSTNSV